METIATLFKALSDTSRLRILNLLFHSGELCVCDIESVMGFTQTKVSRHLAYLTRAGLVAYRKQGLWILYSIPRPGNEDQRRVITCLGTLLRANTVAQRDAQRLESRISAGCCATFERVKPGTRPITKSIHQRCVRKEECLS